MPAHPVDVEPARPPYTPHSRPHVSTVGRSGRRSADTETGDRDTTRSVSRFVGAWGAAYFHGACAQRHLVDTTDTTDTTDATDMADATDATDMTDATDST